MCRSLCLGRLSLFLALAGGCATHPPGDTGALAGRDRAKVSGRLGAGAQDAFPAQVTLEHLPGKETFEIVLKGEDSDDDGWSVPFAVLLPPGRFRVTDWEIDTGDCIARGPDLGLEFDVPAGRDSCMGSLVFEGEANDKIVFLHTAGCAAAQPSGARGETLAVKGKVYRASVAVPASDEAMHTLGPLVTNDHNRHGWQLCSRRDDIPATRVRAHAGPATLPRNGPPPY